MNSLKVQLKSLSLPKNTFCYYIPTQISKQISQDTSDEEEALRGKTLVFNYYPPYQDPSSRLKKEQIVKLKCKLVNS